MLSLVEFTLCCTNVLFCLDYGFRFICFVHFVNFLFKISMNVFKLRHHVIHLRIAWTRKDLTLVGVELATLETDSLV